VSRRICALLESERTGWIIVGLAVLLALPSVGSGFISDDYTLLRGLEGRRSGAPPWYDLYHLLGRNLSAEIERGLLPWWTAPNAQLHLLRPVPSMLLALDHAVFGHRAYGYHLHSLAWFAALLTCARALFLHLFQRRTATLALFIFALSPNFAVSSRWLAARHLVVAGVGATAGLLWLVRSEEHPPRRWLAFAAFIFALASGETGLGGLALWAAYETLGPRARQPHSRRWRALIPVLFGVSYLGIYAAVGAGARAIDVYIDPVGDPIGFAKTAAMRLPLLLGNALWLVEAGLGTIWPTPIIATGLIGAAALALVYAQAWPAIPVSDRTALRWLVPGAVLAMAGLAGGMPGGRELVIVSLGFAPFIATLLLHGWRRYAMAARSWPRRLALALLGFIHVVIGPVAALATWQFVLQLGKESEAIARQMVDAAGDARQVVLLTAADVTVWLYALPLARDAHLGSFGDACWWIASAAKGRHLLTRTGPQSFAVETIDTTFHRELFEGLFRARRLPLRAGDEVEQCSALLRVGPLRDGLPDRLEARLDRALDDPSVALLAWRNGKIERIAASELSGSVEIPWSAGPTGGL
jgi:hypothetical protein